jgi:hypothetical protein
MHYRRSRLPYLLGLAAVAVLLSSSDVRERLFRGVIPGRPADSLEVYRPMKAYGLEPGQVLAALIPTYAEVLRVRTWALAPLQLAERRPGAALRYAVRIGFAPKGRKSRSRVVWFEGRLPRREELPDRTDAPSQPGRFLPGKALVPLESRSVTFSIFEERLRGAPVRIELLPDWELVEPGGEALPAGPPRILCMVYEGRRPEAPDPGPTLAGLGGRRLRRTFQANVLPERRALRLEDRLVLPIRYRRLPTLDGVSDDLELIEMYVRRSLGEPEPELEQADGPQWTLELLPGVTRLVNCPPGCRLRIDSLGPPGELVEIERIDEDGRVRRTRMELDMAGVAAVDLEPLEEASTVYFSLYPGQENAITVRVRLGTPAGWRPHPGLNERSVTRYYEVGEGALRFEVPEAAQAALLRFGFRAADPRPRRITVESFTPGGRLVRRSELLFEPVGPGAPPESAAGTTIVPALDRRTGAPLSELMSVYLRAGGARRIRITADAPVLVSAFRRWREAPETAVYSDLRLPGTRISPAIDPEEAERPAWVLLRPANYLELAAEHRITHVEVVEPWIRRDPLAVPGPEARFESLIPIRPAAQQMVLEPVDPERLGGRRIDVGAFYLVGERERAVRIRPGEEGLSGYLILERAGGGERPPRVELLWNGERLKRLTLRAPLTHFRAEELAGSEGELRMRVRPRGARVRLALSCPAAGEDAPPAPDYVARRLTYLPPGSALVLQEFLQPPETVNAVVYGFDLPEDRRLLRFRARFIPPRELERVDEPFLDSPGLEKTLRVRLGPRAAPLLANWGTAGGRRLGSLPVHLGDAWLPGLYRMELVNENPWPLWCRFVKSIESGPESRVVWVGGGLTVVVNLEAGRAALIRAQDPTPVRLQLRILGRDGSQRVERWRLDPEHPYELTAAEVARTAFIEAPESAESLAVVVQQERSPLTGRAADSDINAMYYETSAEAAVRFEMPEPVSVEESCLRLAFRMHDRRPRRITIVQGDRAGVVRGTAQAVIQAERFGLSRDLRLERPISDAVALYLVHDAPGSIEVRSDPPAMVACFARTGEVDEAVYAPRAGGLILRAPGLSAEPETRRWDSIPPADHRRLAQEGRQAVIEIQNPWIQLPRQETDQPLQYAALDPEDTGLPQLDVLERVAPGAVVRPGRSELHPLPQGGEIFLPAGSGALSGVVLRPAGTPAGGTLTVQLDGRPWRMIDLDWRVTRFRLRPPPGDHRLRFEPPAGAEGIQVLVNRPPREGARPLYKARTLVEAPPGAELVLRGRFRLPGRITAIVYPGLPSDPDAPRGQVLLDVQLEPRGGMGGTVRLLRAPLILRRRVRVQVEPETRLLLADGRTLRTGRPVYVPITLSDGLPEGSLRVRMRNRSERRCWLRFVSQDLLPGEDEP